MENLQKIYNLIVYYHSQVPYLQYIILVLLIGLFLVFIYKVFIFLEENGFNKERSLDLVLLSTIFFIIPVFAFYNTFTLNVYLNYTKQNIIWSVLSVFIFLLFRSRFGMGSFYKMLDLFSISIGFLIGNLYLLAFLSSLNFYYFFISVLYLLFAKSLLNSYKSKFVSLFKHIKLYKADNLSFIGGVGLLFLLFNVTVDILTNVLTKNYDFRLFFGLGLFVLIFFLFIKKSKQNKIIWHLQINLLRNKNKNLQKKETSLF